MAAECRITNIGATVQNLPSAAGDTDPWTLYFAPTSIGHSLIVYDDGRVQEGIGFTIWDTKRPGVAYWIQGGTQYLVEQGSWLYDTLLAAGYTFDCSGSSDEYSADYQSAY